MVADSPCCVYRFYDRSGTLLYVGMTGRLLMRPQQHEQTQPWWNEVATMTVEHYPDRPSASFAEKAAVRAENPLYNEVRFAGKTPLQSFRCDADVWRAAQEKAKSEGTDLSKVLREFLGKYLRD